MLFVSIENSKDCDKILMKKNMKKGVPITICNWEIENG